MFKGVSFPDQNTELKGKYEDLKYHFMHIEDVLVGLKPEYIDDSETEPEYLSRIRRELSYVIFCVNEVLEEIGEGDAE